MIRLLEIGGPLAVCAVVVLVIAAREYVLLKRYGRDVPWRR